MEQVITTKENKKEYKIIPSFNNDGENIEKIIQNAFLKYLKYNDYKWFEKEFFSALSFFIDLIYNKLKVNTYSLGGKNVSKYK